MATHGTLEMRLGQNALVGATTHDGYRAYEIVPRFLTFLESPAGTDYSQYEKWFRETAEELLPFEHSRTGWCS